MSEGEGGGEREIVRKKRQRDKKRRGERGPGREREGKRERPFSPFIPFSNPGITSPLPNLKHSVVSFSKSLKTFSPPFILK